MNLDKPDTRLFCIYVHYHNPTSVLRNFVIYLYSCKIIYAEFLFLVLFAVTKMIVIRNNVLDLSILYSTSWIQF